jgi:hypothetical protein
VAARHNDAGRKLLKAIANGQMGGSLVMADVGNAEKMASEGITCNTVTHVPASVLPNVHPTTLRTLRPDGMIVHNMDKDPKQRSVYIIEIKYTADTNRDLQTARAASQHDQLEGLLTSHGYQQHNIQRITILLGVGGTVYTDSIDALVTLGVAPNDAEKALKQVHRLSVQWLHKIYKYKIIASKQRLRDGVG